MGNWRKKLSHAAQDFTRSKLDNRVTLGRDPKTDYGFTFLAIDLSDVPADVTKKQFILPVPHTWTLRGSGRREADTKSEKIGSWEETTGAVPAEGTTFPRRSKRVHQDEGRPSHVTFCKRDVTLLERDTTILIIAASSKTSRVSPHSVCRHRMYEHGVPSAMDPCIGAPRCSSSTRRRSFRC